MASATNLLFMNCKNQVWWRQNLLPDSGRQAERVDNRPARTECRERHVANVHTACVGRVVNTRIKRNVAGGGVRRWQCWAVRGMGAKVGWNGRGSV